MQDLRHLEPHPTPLDPFPPTWYYHTYGVLILLRHRNQKTRSNTLPIDPTHHAEAIPSPSTSRPPVSSEVARPQSPLRPWSLCPAVVTSPGSCSAPAVAYVDES